ncbi:cysteine proteinase [Saccharata proteae CBS 121410]|uniref:Cysteine proteinase n=1 Tax=Saccharata proteae CBS 121410 TaxID=1314787 RepID=A0A9P4M095_9PEZI|nr:cysteine proteinase [Saccharata proteae CBS 121410]
MEALLSKHRKEQRDLQSRITQKKKSATKKTRKGVNDECATLERDLKERQDREIAELSGAAAQNGADGGQQETVADQLVEASESLAELRVEETPAQHGDETTAASNGAVGEGQQQQQQQQQPQRKPNRQKARLARRAAEQEAAAAEAASEAASMPDLRKKEREALLEQFQKRGLREQVIRADGHCLYSAVADQMGSLELDLQPRIAAKVVPAEREEGDGGKADVNQEGYKTVRRTAAEWISGHADDFAPFLEEPLEEYVYKVRDTAEWGGHMELLALARSYGVKINVLHGDGRVDAIEPAAEGEAEADGEEKEVWLAYYKHGFGLGEHYNSLRKVA